MIEFVSVIVAIAGIIIAIRRFGLVSPFGIVLTLLSANVLCFFIIEFIKAASDEYFIHSYKFSRSYLESSSPFLITYTTTILILIISSLSFGRAKSGASLYFDSYLFRSRRAFVANFAIVALLTLLVLIHAYITKMAFLQPYGVYLALRNPDYFGISSYLLRIMHANIGMIGILSSVVLYLSFKSKNPILIFLSLLCFAYFATYQAASLSRWMSLQIAVFLMLSYSDKSMRVRPWTLALYIIAPSTYFGVMNGRNYSDLGVASFFQGVMQGASSHFLVYTVSNLFGGGLVLSEAALKAGTSYPLVFKVLSFSPLPSFIDKFQEVRAIYDVRINVYGPFSTYAELYWFGALWYALFMLIVVVSLRQSEKAWRLNGGGLVVKGLAILSFALTAYGHMFTHQYPIRSSLRWIILSGIIGFAACYIAKRSSISKDVQAQAATK